MLIFEDFGKKKILFLQNFVNTNSWFFKINTMQATKRWLFSIWFFLNWWMCVKEMFWCIFFHSLSVSQKLSIFEQNKLKWTIFMFWVVKWLQIDEHKIFFTIPKVLGMPFYSCVMEVLMLLQIDSNCCLLLCRNYLIAIF